MYPKTFIETSRKIRTKQFIMVMQFRVVNIELSSRKKTVSKRYSLLIGASDGT